MLSSFYMASTIRCSSHVCLTQLLFPKFIKISFLLRLDFVQVYGILVEILKVPRFYNTFYINI